MSGKTHSGHYFQSCQELFSEKIEGTSSPAMILMSHAAMPYKALVQLRLNVETLLTQRRRTKADLAAEMKIDPSTLTKFLNGTREIQFHHLDGMASFFGLPAYQLFQPGISPLLERRTLKDRRMGLERRQRDRLAHVPIAADDQSRKRRQLK